jgi:hypothetical protein
MKNLLHKIGAFFTLIFGGAKKFEQFLENHVDEGISIMSSVEKVISGELVTDLISFLPTPLKTVASNLQSDIEAKLDKVITEIAGGQSCLSLPTFAEKVTCLANYIKSLSQPMQQAALMKGASLYVQAAAPNAKVSTVDTMVQTRYFAQKNNMPITGDDEQMDISTALIDPSKEATAVA